MSAPDMEKPRQCIICSSCETRPLFHPRRSPGPVVQCLGCGYIFVARLDHPEGLILEGPLLGGLPPSIATSSNLADLPEGYWELKLLPHRLLELPALEQNALQVLQRLERHTAPGKIFDLGCGWGFFLEFARRRGWEPYGLEPLPGHSLYARARLRLPVITDTLRDDTFPMQFFSAVTAFQVFEHLPDPAKTLRQISQFQPAGGVLQIEVPNIDTWGVKVLRSHHRHFNPDHINFFSAQTMTRFLEKHGYQAIEIYYPDRYLTLQHLVNYWFRRALPASLATPLIKIILRRVNPQRLIRLNFGDILGVAARKGSTRRSNELIVN